MNVSGEIRLGIVLTALWAVILTFLTQNICPSWSFLSMNTCIMNLSISFIIPTIFIWGFIWVISGFRYRKDVQDWENFKG